jgi:hypothetical protein
MKINEKKLKKKKKSKTTCIVTPYWHNIVLNLLHVLGRKNERFITLDVDSLCVWPL